MKKIKYPVPITGDVSQDWCDRLRAISHLISANLEFRDELNAILEAKLLGLAKDVAKHIDNPPEDEYGDAYMANARIIKPLRITAEAVILRTEAGEADLRPCDFFRTSLLALIDEDEVRFSCTNYADFKERLWWSFGCDRDTEVLARSQDKCLRWLKKFKDNNQGFYNWASGRLDFADPKPKKEQADLGLTDLAVGEPPENSAKPLS